MCAVAAQTSHKEAKCRRPQATHVSHLIAPLLNFLGRTVVYIVIDASSTLFSAGMLDKLTATFRANVTDNYCICYVADTSQQQMHGH